MEIKHTTLLAPAIAGSTLTARAQDVLPFPWPGVGMEEHATLRDLTRSSAGVADHEQ